MMKKRIVSIMVCVVLMFVMVGPCLSFADNAAKMLPGRVIVSLYEQYLGDFSDLFPDVLTDKVVDVYLSVALSSPSYDPDTGLSDFMKSRVGTLFEVYLTEKSESALIKALAVFNSDSRVKYAEPDGVVGADGITDIVPGEVIIDFKDKFEGDISALFPGLKIEKWEDVVASLLEKDPDSEYLLSVKCKTFCVSLEDKTEDAIYKAIDEIIECSLVSSAYPNYIVNADDDGETYEATVADALAVLRIAAKLVKLDPESIQAVDFDNDGKVTVADALAVLRVAAKLCDPSACQSLKDWRPHYILDDGQIR